MPDKGEATILGSPIVAAALNMRVPYMVPNAVPPSVQMTPETPEMAYFQRQRHSGRPKYQIAKAAGHVPGTGSMLTHIHTKT